MLKDFDVPFSASAAALLGAAAPLTVVCAPSGLGAVDVVLRWLEATGTPHVRVGADRPEQIEVPEAFAGVETLGAVVVESSEQLSVEDLGLVARPSGWRVIAVDAIDGRDVSGVDTAVISGRDLVLTQAEVTDILVAAGAPEVDATVGDGLMSLTHGWPSLVGIVAEQVRRFGLDPLSEAVHYAVREHLRTSTMPALSDERLPGLDYFAVVGEAVAEELDGADPTVRRTSVDAMFHAALLDRVGDQGRFVLRLLAPLGQLLREELRARDPDRHRATLRAVVAARRESGVLDGGLAAAYELRDWDACRRIIERWWFSLSFFGDRALTHEVVMNLPSELLERSPICSNLAELYGVVGRGLAPRLPATEDETAGLAASSTARPFMEHSAIAIIARRYNGRAAEARSLALAAAEVVDRTTHAHVQGRSRPGAGAAVADFKTFWYLHAALACVVADDPSGALRLYRHGWRDQQWDASGFAARGVAVNLAAHHAILGNQPEVARWVSSAEELTVASRYAAMFQARILHLVEFISALDAVDLRRAASSLGQTHDLSTRNEHWPFAFWAEVRHALLSHVPQRALQLVEDAPTHQRRTVASDGIHPTVLRMLRAEAEMALGRGNRAEQAVREGVTSAYFGGVTAARFSYLTGDFDGARSVAAQSALEPWATVRTQVESGLLWAASALETGDESAAESAARRALAALVAANYEAGVLAIPADAIRRIAALAKDLDVLRIRREEIAIPDLYPARLEFVRLTDRESVLLEQLFLDRTVEEVAEALYVSRSTVKTQRRSLYAKLGVGSRSEALLRARELGLAKA